MNKFSTKPGFLDSFALTKIVQTLPSAEQLAATGWRVRFNPFDGEPSKLVLNNEPGAPRLTLTICPLRFWHLQVELSINAWLRGSNVWLADADDVRGGLTALSKFVRERAGVPFDAATANVCRADFSRDFLIGESKISTAIQHIRKAKIPRMEMRADRETTYFEPPGKRKSKLIRVYPKLPDVIAKSNDSSAREAAKGVLRCEVSLMKTKSVSALKKRLKLPSRQAHDVLTARVAENVLSDVCQRLQLESAFQSDDFDIGKLFETYGAAKAESLIGFLMLRRSYGENFYNLPSFSYSKATYFRRLDDLRKAGLNP